MKTKILLAIISLVGGILLQKYSADLTFTTNSKDSQAYLMNGNLSEYCDKAVTAGFPFKIHYGNKDCIPDYTGNLAPRIYNGLFYALIIYGIGYLIIRMKNKNAKRI